MGKAKAGDSIKIIEKSGEPSYTGRAGVVKIIDSVGQLHGSWGGLSIREDNDRYKIIKKGRRR